MRDGLACEAIKAHAAIGQKMLTRCRCEPRPAIRGPKPRERLIHQNKPQTSDAIRRRATASPVRRGKANSTSVAERPAQPNAGASLSSRDKVSLLKDFARRLSLPESVKPIVWPRWAASGSRLAGVQFAVAAHPFGPVPISAANDRRPQKVVLRCRAR